LTLFQLDFENFVSAFFQIILAHKSTSQNVNINIQDMKLLEANKSELVIQVMKAFERWSVESKIIDVFQGHWIEYYSQWKVLPISTVLINQSFYQTVCGNEMWVRSDAA